MATDIILTAANRYADGLVKVTERRKQWLDKHKEIREHLKQIAAFLNENAAYKPGFYVDTNHAYNEAINGTCANMPSLTFRSGDMPLQISFKNAAGNRKEYVEEGFYITFTPTITGQILVLLLPHYSTLFSEKPDYMNLAMIDNPASLTNDTIDQIIASGIATAFYSSFTGQIDLQQKEIHESHQQYQHTPIGFKRYESTEKVK